MILVGDIGADDSHITIFSQEKKAREVVTRDKFHNEDFSSLQDILSAFKKKHESLLKEEPIYIACLGVAGPVINGQCLLTHLDWEFRVKDLRELLEVNYVEVLNDMPAIGYAIISQSLESELVDFNPDTETQKGNRAVSLATGKGLGELLLYRDRGGDFTPSPSEGGHANFAPCNNLGVDFLKYLHTTQFTPPISWEKVISWEGLHLVYAFLRDQKGIKETVRLDQQEHETILERANKNDELCCQSIKEFASIYGAGVGDLALRTLAVNGVYIGGGLVQSILRQETTKTLFIDAFMESFKNKEGFDEKRKFAEFNSKIPVKAFVNSDIVLMGALQRAKIMANLE